MQTADVRSVAVSEAEVVKVENLRVLVVGVESTQTVKAALREAGHSISEAPDLAEATEALMVQRFDAVLLPASFPQSEVEEFTAAVRELDRRATSAARTLVLFIVPENGAAPPNDHGMASTGVDGLLCASLDADALTIAIARLAAAVSVAAGASDAVALAPELPILDAGELMEQVAFDNELLLELIDLYLTERARQSEEMAEALTAGDYGRLSRIAHTIKGSLGSLHATAARMTAQSLEVAAHEGDASKCVDFLPVLERDLDVLEEHLLALRRSLEQS